MGVWSSLDNGDALLCRLHGSRMERTVRQEAMDHSLYDSMGLECILESIVLSLSSSGSCLGSDHSADNSDRLVSIRLLLTIADEVGFYSSLLSLAHGRHFSQCLYSIYELAFPVNTSPRVNTSGTGPGVAGIELPYPFIATCLGMSLPRTA